MFLNLVHVRSRTIAERFTVKPLREYHPRLRKKHLCSFNAKNSPLVLSPIEAAAVEVPSEVFVRVIACDTSHTQPHPMFRVVEIVLMESEC